MKWLKSLFKPKVTYVVSIESLLPLYDPEKCIIGVRKGTLSPEEYKNFLDNKPFQYTGSPTDFVVLPKTQQKETQNGTRN